jgi:hypothetical protein
MVHERDALPLALEAERPPAAVLHRGRGDPAEGRSGEGRGGGSSLIPGDNAGAVHRRRRGSDQPQGRGLHSQISTQPQVAIEIFLLEPGEKLLGEHELDLRREAAARKLDEGLA